MNLDTLVKMSNHYGQNPEYVLAGGGNTSFKDGRTLYVKGSGTSLATITEDGFVALNRANLNKMMVTKYSEEDDKREAEALVDMMNARLDTVNGKRPSVEALLHNLFPFSYVLHVHPAKINGLTCSQNGAKLTEELFGGKAVWIPITKPGYILAKVCYDALNEYKAQNGADAQILLLENHGIFVAGNSVVEIHKLFADVLDKIDSQISATPDFSDVEFDCDLVKGIAPKLRMLYGQGSVCSFITNKELIKPETFENIKAPFSPDHIVYLKAEYLYITAQDDLKEKFNAFKAAKGYAPKVVYLENQGYFVLGDTKKDVETAKLLLLDAVKISIYAKNFGGKKPMEQSFVDFIVNWEVESYRAKAGKTALQGRMQGKIIIVTGGAQGFGLGISQELIKEGANIVIADMNADGAKQVADDMNKEYGAGRAMAVAVNVADEDSVKNLILQTVLAYGGLDVLVNNAGIARAGSLEQMTKKDFELVTSVNYTAYFLCAKYAIEPMKAQFEICPQIMSDIVCVNSKSGLKGSNKNFAYAGSKFGGLGLTQSFALELAPFNIKVNAVCPGNYLDGPLWSDPERGLFVQYFNAGKVPGAKSVEDVRRHYESLVPLSRGCFPSDVAKAIMYAVEQPYETGQAIPVTGGQEMLK